MGLQPINEDMLDDIINKIKDSDVVKKIEDFRKKMHSHNNLDIKD